MNLMKDITQGYLVMVRLEQAPESWSLKKFVWEREGALAVRSSSNESIV